MSEYKRIRRALLKQSPRFKRTQILILLRFLIPLLLLIALVALFIYQASIITAVALPVAAVLAAWGFWWLNRRYRLFGWRIYGTVTDVEKEIRWVNSPKNIYRMVEKTFVILSVTTPKGKIKKIDLPYCYLRVFPKGDKILRMVGMQYPVDLTPEDFLICPFCGNVFPKENTYCVGCGETALNAEIINQIKKNK